MDIAPSSIDNPARFYDAVLGNPAVANHRFYYPHIPGKPRSEVADSAFQKGSSLGIIPIRRKQPHWYNAKT